VAANTHSHTASSLAATKEGDDQKNNNQSRAVIDIIPMERSPRLLEARRTRRRKNQLRHARQKEKNGKSRRTTSTE